MLSVLGNSSTTAPVNCLLPILGDRGTDRQRHHRSCYTKTSRVDKCPHCVRFLTRNGLVYRTFQGVGLSISIKITLTRSAQSHSGSSPLVKGGISAIHCLGTQQSCTFESARCQLTHSRRVYVFFPTVCGLAKINLTPPGADLDE